MACRADVREPRRPAHVLQLLEVAHALPVELHDEVEDEDDGGGWR